MPIEYREGDLFESGADWLTVPVNMKGVMGAGLARQFTLRYPRIEDRYRQAISAKALRLGHPFPLYSPGKTTNILLFATKDHWKDPSKLSWIDAGLASLAERIVTRSRFSIALPPLGCGLGGLDWNEVRPLIEQHLGGLEAQILVYEPGRRSAS